VLDIALVSSICGGSCVDIADFARDRGDLFREFLELPGGMLGHHDTFSRCSACSIPAAFGGCFAALVSTIWMRTGRACWQSTARQLRRLLDSAAGRSALLVATAFATGARVVIGQVAAGDKESEIVAARTPLGLIDLKGILAILYLTYPAIPPMILAIGETHGQVHAVSRPLPR
jgi:hypothetical protein